VNSPSDFNITFRILGPGGPRSFNACKALILYRTLERERSGFLKPSSKCQTGSDSHQLKDLIDDPDCPLFLKEVFHVHDKGLFDIDPSFVRSKFEDDLPRACAAFYILMCYLYTDRIKQRLTLVQMRDVCGAAEYLGLK
jgi:hypothetical protein